MRRVLPFAMLLALVAAPAVHAAAKPDWKMNATIIEACSCPMFCQCYFAAAPAGHNHDGQEEHYCRFNNAFRVNKGDYKGTKLDGAKFWVYGDLGGDFSKGQMDWVVLTFDKATSPEQRKAIGDIVGHLYPVKWNSVTTAEGTMEWVPGKDEAYATLDGGKSAEVRLSTKSLNRERGAEPMVIRNLKYWGASHNDGFVLMPNVVEAARAGDKPFEFNGTNGFMITFDIDSKTAQSAANN